MSQLVASLRAVGQFSDEEIDLFMSKLQPMSLAKGDHLLHEGQVSKTIGFLETGLVMYYQLMEGEEVARDFIIENNWVTYLKSFTNQSVSDMNIKALEDCTLLTLSFTDMMEVFTKYPKFIAVKNFYVEKSFVDIVQHSANLAMLDAKQRYYKLMEEKPELINRVPQYYIASYLGIKPQSLSRIRKDAHG